MHRERIAQQSEPHARRTGRDEQDRARPDRSATGISEGQPQRHDAPDRAPRGPSAHSTAPGRAARADDAPRNRDTDARPNTLTSNTQHPTTDTLRGHLAERIGQDAYERYLGRAADLDLNGDGLRITANSRFAADLIRERFDPAVRDALTASGLPAGTPVIYTHSTLQSTPAAPDRAPAPAAPARHGLHSPPATKPAPSRRRRPADDPRTLENFVVGRCNRLAFEAARRVAEDDTATGACPLFLYGPCGVGKTHLLTAAARRFTARFPDARVRVLSAEAFTNEYIGSLRAGKIESFHRAYRKIDMLCIDDVHFLSKKSGTQNELLHTFDALDLRGSRLVLASDNHPRQIKAFSGALVSRFVSGSITRLEPPDEDTRCRLLEAFARRAGLEPDRAAIETLAAAADADPHGDEPSVRDLMGLINRAQAFLRLSSGESATRLTAAVASGVLRSSGISGAGSHAGTDPSSRPIPIDRIIDSVCSAFALTRADLAGRGRSKPAVLGRAMIALLARRLTRRSYPEIADAIGRPTHSTIIGAHKRITAQIERGESVEIGLHCDGVPIGRLAERLERELRTA